MDSMVHQNEGLEPVHQESASTSIASSSSTCMSQGSSPAQPSGTKTVFGRYSSNRRTQDHFRGGPGPSSLAQTLLDSPAVNLTVSACAPSRIRIRRRPLPLTFGNDDGNSANSGDENEENDGKSKDHGENWNPDARLKKKPRDNASRKEKSLGLLCQRFVRIILEESFQQNTCINLDSISKRMQVEKRRIYDIVNVMEALGAMEKANKSFYRWRGMDGLPGLLDSLKSQAMEENLPAKVREIQDKMTRFVELSTGNKKGPDTVGTLRTVKKSNDSGFESDLNRSKEANDSRNGVKVQEEGKVQSEKEEKVQSQKEAKVHRPHPSRGGQNSLMHLCRRFMMILVSMPKEKLEEHEGGEDRSSKVSLDVASTILIKNPDVDGYDPPNRSRCRRLYDVANVLVSLRLIKKRTYNFGTKKIPLYMYCGPEPNATGRFDFVEHLITHRLSTETEDEVEAAAIAREEEQLLEFAHRSARIPCADFETFATYEEGPAPKKKRVDEEEENQQNNDATPPNPPNNDAKICEHEVPIVRPQAKAVQQTAVSHSTFISSNARMSAPLYGRTNIDTGHAFRRLGAAESSKSQAAFQRSRIGRKKNRSSQSLSHPDTPQPVPRPTNLQDASRPNSSQDSALSTIQQLVTPVMMSQLGIPPGLMQMATLQQPRGPEINAAAAAIAAGSSRNNGGNAGSNNSGSSTPTLATGPFNIESLLNNPNLLNIPSPQVLAAGVLHPGLLLSITHAMNIANSRGDPNLLTQCTNFVSRYLANFNNP